MRGGGGVEEKKQSITKGKRSQKSGDPADRHLPCDRSSSVILTSACQPQTVGPETAGRTVRGESGLNCRVQGFLNMKAGFVFFLFFSSSKGKAGNSRKSVVSLGS